MGGAGGRLYYSQAWLASMLVHLFGPSPAPQSLRVLSPATTSAIESGHARDPTRTAIAHTHGYTSGKVAFERDQAQSDRVTPDHTDSNASMHDMRFERREALGGFQPTAAFGVGGPAYFVDVDTSINTTESNAVGVGE